jgi:hypothetical protein
MGGDKSALRKGLTSPAAIRLMTASSNRRMGFGSGWFSTVDSVVDCMPSMCKCNAVTTRRDAAIRLEHVIAFGSLFPSA